MKCQFLLLVFTLLSVKAEQRIAGGEVAQLDEFPFATALLSNRGEGLLFTQACGGTIISTTAILSAASCFYTDGVADDLSWWRARVGSVFSTRGGTLFFIRQMTPHPRFSPTTRDVDLAVLRTNWNLILSADISRATIAGAALPLDTHQPITAIGWGITQSGGQPSDELRQVQFFVVDHQVCTNRYAELNFTVTEDMVCTGWLDVGVLAQCEGDNGSPVIMDGMIVGVHSKVEGCMDGYYPGINTRVGPFTRWIVDTAVA